MPSHFSRFSSPSGSPGNGNSFDITPFFKSFAGQASQKNILEVGITEVMDLALWPDVYCIIDAELGLNLNNLVP